MGTVDRVTPRYADPMADDWVTDLERVAPDVVAAWRGIDEGRFLGVRREVRRRARSGSTERLLDELESLAAALVAMIDELPDDAFDRPGGEKDWTVAEAIGHVAASRAGLVIAAGLAASGCWPADAPTVVPSVPGSSDLGRADLVRKVEQSQRIIARSAHQVADHEEEPCPLDHPLVGRLRCGEWLLFAGVHDVMHLEQLHRIAAGLTPDER